MENKILAVVNGREIKESDIQQAILRFPKDKQQYLSSDAGKKQLLDQTISFELIYLDAKEKGFEEDPEYTIQLEAMKREILTQVGIKKELEKLSVSEQEAKDYYEANKDKFKTKPSVNAKHILVDSEDSALNIKKEIEEGKTFEDAAKQYSTCPSKEEGGSLGNFSKGQMVPEFEAAAFSQIVGEVGEPVKTQFGYHLIKVEDKIEEGIMPFEDVKVNILNGLVQERQNMRYTQYAEELKKKYAVEIK